MKFYEDPVFDVQKLAIEDIITNSTPTPDEDETDRVFPK